MPKLRMTLPKEFNDFCCKNMFNWSAENIEQCRQMLAPCDPNAHDRGGYKETALHKHIPLEIVEWLVERGADVNIENTYGTPLFKHALAGDYDICKFLIEHGADVNIAAHAGRTALFHAVSGRNCEIVRLLLAHGADPCHHTVKWDECQTPLLHMLSEGTEAWHESKPDMAEALIKAQKEQGGIPEEEWRKAREYVSDMGHKFELYKSGMSPDDSYCRQIEAVMNRFYIIFDITPAKPVIKHDGKSLIAVDESLSVAKQHNALWEFLVPPKGNCATLQGEVIRITGRVDREINVNGGVNWNVEYQKMLEALTQYFLQGNVLSEDEIKEAESAIKKINHFKAPLVCQEQIDYLAEAAVKWIKQNPEPILLEKVTYNL
jgi:cellobiose-specific phosphotransferase system component IIA